MIGFDLPYLYVSFHKYFKEGGRKMSIVFNRIRLLTANAVKLDSNGKMASDNPALLDSIV